MNLSVKGTLGVILAAKERGVIPHVKPIFADFLKVGYHISSASLNQAIILACET